MPMVTRLRLVGFVFVLLAALLFLALPSFAQASQCPPIGEGAAKIVLEVTGDPRSPYTAEVRGAPPVWPDPPEYIVIPAGAGEPPRRYLDPMGFLYEFARIDWNGWGYYLIPQEDPYIVQPTREDFERLAVNWNQFQNPAAVEAFQSLSLTSAYQGWWSDDAYDAPISDDIVALWYVYDERDELLEYGMVWGSDDGTLLYPARWTTEKLDEPYPADGFKHPACWDSMSPQALDAFKQLVLDQRAAWLAQ